jgi:hypothetical protein
MNRNRFVSSLGWLVSIGLLPFTVTGCGPRLNSSEFGTILHEIPKVPGADKPYPMPQLDEPKPAADEPTTQQTSEPAQDSPLEHGADKSDSTTEPQE